jgi:hypothetical protein
MTKKTLRFCFLAVFCIPAFVSCASASFAAIDKAVYSGQYKTALNELEKDKKNIYKKDAILYYLDKGMLSHYAAEYKNSTELLQKGDRAIEEMFTKSITRNIASFIANDNTKEYAGEDYENLYLNIFNALNYYQMNNFEDAMVEIRRIEEKLRYLSVKYNDTEAELAKQDKDAANSAKVNVNFSNCALARYLGMLFYRTNYRFDDARIDRDFLKRAFVDEKNIYTHPVPSSIEEELSIPKNKARLNILCFSGLSPVKTEEVIRIPLIGTGTGNWIKIALPRMVKRTSDVGAIDVIFQDGKKIRLELLEDMQNVAMETFKKHRSITEAKSIIRATIKGGTAAGFSSLSDKNAGMGLIGIGLQIFAEVSEHADLRSSRYFPGRAFVGGITLDPGIYAFKVNYYSVAGYKMASYPFDTVEIKPEKLNLIETCFFK